MQAEIEALAALVAPPRKVPALDPGSAVPLPSDHLMLVRRYGPGVFMPDLALHVPGGARDGGFDLAELVATYTEIHAARAEEDETPIATWPTPGGVLPWADDGDAGALHFVTQGPRESWTVALVDYEEFSLTPLEGTSTAVLLALHRGNLDLPGLAGGELAAHRRFIPAHELDDD